MAFFLCNCGPWWCLRDLHIPRKCFMNNGWCPAIRRRQKGKNLPCNNKKPKAQTWPSYSNQTHYPDHNTQAYNMTVSKTTLWRLLDDSIWYFRLKTNIVSKRPSHESVSLQIKTPTLNVKGRKQHREKPHSARNSTLICVPPITSPYTITLTWYVHIHARK